MRTHASLSLIKRSSENTQNVRFEYLIYGCFNVPINAIYFKPKRFIGKNIQQAAPQ
ncbi:hypothetical protein HMPREF3156_01239 [Neisseria sp. HMSC06F02]|nr:hypothetical protein HMPREF3156_01239 [Neisseria sp. HMSC06F02]